jgi:hypothetical protein
MIGGVDVVIPSRAIPRQAVILSLRLIRRYWPEAVIEDVRTGQRSPLKMNALFPETGEDLFVYTNEGIARRWDQVGAEPELANTMVHILARESGITFVVDDPQSGIMPGFLSSVRSALATEVFRTGVRVKGVAA